MFQGGPYHELLQSLLGAYVCYRPDVGYVSVAGVISTVIIVFIGQIIYKLHLYSQITNN